VRIIHGGGRRPVAGGFVVHAVYTFEVDDPALDFVVEVDVDNSGPVPRVAAVVCIARDDDLAVRGEQLRKVALTRYVREAATGLHPGRAVRGRSGHVAGALYPLDADQRRQYLAARRREERAGLRRVTTDDLRRVADAYRAALAAGQPPTVAVQHALGLNSRGQAARWVEKAREAGILGPAPGWRRAGELPLPDQEPIRTTRAPLPNRSTVPRLAPPEDEPTPKPTRRPKKDTT
jgi:hypothetical protein